MPPVSPFPEWRPHLRPLVPTLQCPVIIRLQSTLPAGEFDCHGGKEEEEEEEDFEDNKLEEDDDSEEKEDEDGNKKEETQPPFACSLIGFCWRGYNRRVPDVISSLFFVPPSNLFPFLRPSLKILSPYVSSRSLLPNPLPFKCFTNLVFSAQSGQQAGSTCVISFSERECPVVLCFPSSS